MRNEIAEWVLSQAAPPEQAKTILGDLLEAQPGPVAFWFAVLRATISIGVRPPFRLLRSLFGSYASAFVFVIWLLMHYDGQSLLSALSIAILIGLPDLWRWRKKRIASSRRTS